jgi:hypothetical protein
MQAIGLVTNDDFLVPYNLSIETYDVLNYIKILTWDWDGAMMHTIHFDDYYGIDFAEIIGQSGFCYNFNMVNASDLFHLEK